MLGAILLASGVVLLVNAHWDELGPGSRFALVLGMVSVFHLGGTLTRERFGALSTALHAVGTIATGAAIALVGQIFNIEEHWPAAVLMWALAAVAGWWLLRDEAQQTLAVLLAPAWIFCEWSYAAEHFHGHSVYLGRMLAVWAVLYLTVWMHSRRRIVWGLCFAAGAIAMVVASILLLAGWNWEYGSAGFLPWGLRLWGWAAIAAGPLAVAILVRRRSVIPVAAAVVTVIALPFCQTQTSESYWNGQANDAYTHSAPNLAAHALVAAFAILLVWWGVREASKRLVNYGIVLFALAVMWFFFADIFSKLGRSLGLIGLGILFLAGGWGIEKMRRRLIAAMHAPQEAI